MSKIEFNSQSNYCLNCGSDRLRNFKAQASDAESPSVIYVIECRNCFFAWQYPLGRTEEDSVQYFEDAYDDGGQTKSDYFNENKKRDIAKLEFDFVATLPAENRKLLDIGAGAGIFAEVAAENDWSVTAVDPAIDIDRLKNNPNIRAIKGTTAQMPKGELFDVITLWDVVEHAMNPTELIYDANKYLREDGWIVLETGNYKSADRVSGGMSHWMYQLDHRWYFSPESLERLLTDAGFSNFIFSDKVLRPDWNSSVAYAGPSRTHLLKSIVKAPLQLPLHLSSVRP